jgi:hypothetical protein
VPWEKRNGLERLVLQPVPFSLRLIRQGLRRPELPDDRVAGLVGVRAAGADGRTTLGAVTRAGARLGVDILGRLGVTVTERRGTVVGLILDLEEVGVLGRAVTRGVVLRS